MNKTRNETTDIAARVEKILDEIVAIRRDLHSHPELSEHETRTEAKISEFLTQWGIPHQTGIAGHGVVGLIGGEKTDSPVVAIRADIDALPIEEKNDVPYRSQNPGVMHACGHDIHTAVLLGTAKVLKSMETELPGRVKLLFQPAEETVGGALPMIQAGCLENPRVDAVIGLHVEPEVPSGALEFRRGAMNAASNEFVIKVKGASSHGARPQSGIDAVLAASHVVCALQSVVSRNVSAVDSAVVTVGSFNAGTAGNILAGEANLKGIVRTLNPRTRELAVARVREVAELTAKALGAEAQVDFVDSYPALINNDGVEAVLEETAARYFPPEKILFRKVPSMGAEDFSYFCDARPAAYFNIGTRPADEAMGNRPAANLHSAFYCPDEGCIRAGILMECAGTLELLRRLADGTLPAGEPKKQVR